MYPDSQPWPSKMGARGGTWAADPAVLPPPQPEAALAHGGRLGETGWLARHCLVYSRCRQRLPDPCLPGSHHPGPYSSARTASRAELGVQGTAWAATARHLHHMHLCTPCCLTQEGGGPVLPSLWTHGADPVHPPGPLVRTWPQGSCGPTLIPPWSLHKELLSTCSPGEPGGSSVLCPSASLQPLPRHCASCPPPPPPTLAGGTDRETTHRARWL